MLVLDLGCGHGTELGELVQRGCQAIGIDVERESLTNCRNRGLRVLQACAEQMPLRSANLDGLVLRNDDLEF